MEARSAAFWGHQVANAGRGGGLTVTGGGALSRVGEILPDVALSATISWDLTEARGSELVLLDERNEPFARRWADTPVTLTEGCAVKTGLTGSAGIAYFTSAVEVRKGCSWARNYEGETTRTPDRLQNGSRARGA